MLFANVIRDFNPGNYFLHPWFWSAFLAWITAQTIKIVRSAVKTRSVDFEYLVSTGGMPSAHSAMVTGLATSIGLTEGFGSPIAMLALGCDQIMLEPILRRVALPVFDRWRNDEIEKLSRSFSAIRARRCAGGW